MSRRELLTTGMAGSAALSARATASPRRSGGLVRGMDGPGRIDVHQHLLPPEFLAALNRHGLGAWAPAAWSADGAVAMMDAHQIATGVLSLSTPGPHLGDDAEARVLARQVNERLAALVATRPGRFGMFASVPLPDVDGALAAVAYAYDHLAADGVILLANSRGTYLGDPAFEPLMDELDRRRAVVLVHPGPLPGGLPIKGIHPSLADFLLDTTRAAINLVSHAVPRRYPNIRMILSHGGGFLPYAAYRIANLASVIDTTVSSTAMLEDLSTFYFDTALAGSPTVLPSLLTFARPDRVLFGSDSPYCPDATVGFFTDHLDGDPAVSPATHAAINRTNAEALFPRLVRS